MEKTSNSAPGPDSTGTCKLIYAWWNRTFQFIGNTASFSNQKINNKVKSKVNIIDSKVIDQSEQIY